MKNKDYISIPIYLLLVLSVIVCLLLGVQYLSSIFLDFKFTTSYGAIFLSLIILVGFILTTPLGIFLEVLFKHIGLVDRGSNLLFQIVQLIVFIFILEFILSYFNIVVFSSDYTEYIYYTIMYCFFFVLAKIGDIVEKSDEE